jgi:hypothetical protein
MVVAGAAWWERGGGKEFGGERKVGGKWKFGRENRSYGFGFFFFFLKAG